MYFRALMLSGCVALTGCQSTEVIEQVQVAQAQQVEKLSELQSVKMKLPSSAIVDITSQSQVLRYKDIDSRV
ncbi:transcriptional regulator, partial [Vibrio rotiferianus]